MVGRPETIRHDKIQKGDKCLGESQLTCDDSLSTERRTTNDCQCVLALKVGGEAIWLEELQYTATEAFHRRKGHRLDTRLPCIVAAVHLRGRPAAV